MTTPITPSARPLTAEDLELVERARQTVDAATDAGPDEDGVHTVGATARANGATGITHIVAVGNHGRGVMAPCGRDRQVLADYHPGVRVIVPTPDGDASVPISELLPLAFGARAEHA